MLYLFIISPLIVSGLFFIKPKNMALKALLFIIKTVCLIAFALMSCRVYWFDLYKIPSESMERTLLIGDKIVIRKDKLPANNEVVVFEMRDWEKPVIMVKRCVGLPGDTLSIRQDSIYINNDYLPEKETVQWTYDYTPDSVSPYQIEQVLARKVRAWKEKEQPLMALTEKEYEQIITAHPDIHMHKATKTANDKGNAFPWKRFLGNNKSNIKPVYIPKKGHTIELNQDNTAWYLKIIESENDSVKMTQGTVSIKGKIIEEYTFKHSYYYMMGDNRNRSQDSRWWGFVREEYMLGKVLFKIKTKPLRFRNID